MLFRPAPRKTLVILQLIILVVLIVVGLAGCAPAPPAPVVQTRYEVERVSLPAGLLSCAPAPAVPPAVTLQSQVATYVVRLYESYEDCSDAVTAIAQIENTPPPVNAGQ